MQRPDVCELDLTKIEGSGDLTCPRCGIEISPDDCTEEAYTILETKVGSIGLEELIILCNNCKTQLHLTGFSHLQELETAGKKPESNNDCRNAY